MITDCPKETKTLCHCHRPRRLRILQLQVSLSCQLIPARPRKSRVGWGLIPRPPSLFFLFSMFLSLIGFEFLFMVERCVYMLGFEMWWFYVGDTPLISLKIQMTCLHVVSVMVLIINIYFLFIRKKKKKKLLYSYKRKLLVSGSCLNLWCILLFRS